MHFMMNFTNPHFIMNFIKKNIKKLHNELYQNEQIHFTAIQNQNKRITINCRGARMIIFKQGDVLDNSISIAHCVSKDLAMKKGLALQIKTRFGGIPDLKRQHAQVGQIAVLKHGTRWIIHLVTKEYYHNKPTQAAIYSTLVHMRQFMLKQGLTIIGIPKLATGLDKQPWPIIKQMLHKIFDDYNILVIVHIL